MVIFSEENVLLLLCFLLQFRVKLKTMQAILEIKDILDKLNHREKNAARKFFTRNYNNTKELQLLNMIDGIKTNKKVNIENRICKLGYSSGSCKSFQKLRSRLKQKLFDYLVSTVSINEVRNIDSHSFLKHRLKKLLFQSEILIEKGFFMQVNDLLRTSLRLAQDYEQFPEIIESLDKLRKVDQIKGIPLSVERLSSKILLFTEINENFKNIESRFNTIVSDIDQLQMINIITKINDLQNYITKTGSISNNGRIALFSEYLNIILLQLNNSFHEAIILVINRLRKFQSESMRHEIQHKMLFYDLYIELLIILDKRSKAFTFISGEDFKLKPAHLKLRGEVLWNHDFLLCKFKGKPTVKRNENYSQIMTNTEIYQLIHDYYIKGEVKKTLEQIDNNIRNFQISSAQQLDIMVLELMCHHDLNRNDLLEYKMQSFLKNLVYREKFEVPLYYHLIFKTFQSFVKGNAYYQPVESLLEELKNSTQCGLYRLKSFQPFLFEIWINKKIRIRNLTLLDDSERKALKVA